MKRSTTRTFVLLSLLLFTTHAVAAKDTWTSIKSKNFTVVGNASESEMRKVTMRLEQFRQAISVLFSGAKIETRVPTTVVLFKSHGSFKPFKPKYKGKTKENVAGYFLPASDLNYIVLTTETGWGGGDPYHIIFHEYEHFILANNMRRAPAWLGEGLAEFVSTLETSDHEQKVRLGMPIAHHVYTLRQNNPLPLKTFFSVDHRSPQYNENDKAGIFYAQSWALIHYLMLGKDGARRPQLTRFINGLNSDLPIEENFRQSFQVDYGKMESELRGYLKNQTYPVLEFTLDKPLELSKDAVSRTMTEAEVEYHLGDLLLHAFRFDEASERLEKSIKLDANFAPAHVSLGLVRLYQRRPAEAQKILRDALALDPRNALAHYHYGSTLNADNKPEEALASFRQAVALKPDLVGAHAGLARIYRDLRKNDEALAAYNQAIIHAPDDPYLYHNRAYLNLQMGRGNGAALDAKTYLALQGWRDDSAPFLALAAYFGHRQKGRAAEAAKMLAEAAAKTDASAWPRPVYKYLAGELTAAELLKQSDNNDKLTESHTYIGLDLSLNGKRAEALPHLRWVAENGNKNFVEYPLAIAEVERIEAAAKTATP
jgi:tetratricopeptide (TPR) repeat protein